jgi:methionyl-tRNA formyltransferase
VFDTVRVPIGPRVTADDLRAELVRVGTEQLVRCLVAPLGEAVPQQGEPLYAAKLKPEELHIDWTSPNAQIDRLVRLGGAWTTFRGKRMKLVEAEPDGSTDGVAPGFRLARVQPEGKPVMAYADWVRGARPANDERFE